MDRGLVSLAAHRGPRGNATSWVTYLPLKKDLYGVQQQTFLRAPMELLASALYQGYGSHLPGGLPGSPWEGTVVTH